MSKEVKKIRELIKMIEALRVNKILEEEDWFKYMHRLEDRLELATEATLVDSSIPQVGDILSSSYGYGMTLVDFYRVVGVTPSGKSVSLHKLHADLVSGDSFTGKVVPSNKLNKHEHPLKKKRVLKVLGGYKVKVGAKTYAYRWDGKPKYFNTLD